MGRRVESILPLGYIPVGDDVIAEDIYTTMEQEGSFRGELTGTCMFFFFHVNENFPSMVCELFEYAATFGSSPYTISVWTQNDGRRVFSIRP